MEAMATARTRYHHGDLKNALVDAAVRLIEQKGVEGLSLRGVAREAGVSQAAPYHHFKDKEALVAEVCCVGFCQLEERLKEARDGIESYPDALDAMGRAYIDFALAHKAYFAIMWGGFVDDKNDYPHLVEEASCTFQMLVDTVVAGQEAGQLRAGEPMELVLSCWAGVHGAARLIVDKGIDADPMREKGIDAALVIESMMKMLRIALAA
jgi:AcrR family transcriptional regulator